MTDCAGLSLSTDGRLRIYNQITLESLKPAENWTSMLNLRRNELIDVKDEFINLDFCCPYEV